MKTVHKWPLVISHIQWIEMPEEAQILSLQVQHGTPHIWALVDPEKPATQRRFFEMYGTGNSIAPDPGPYVGTFQLNGGNFVLHVFEKLQQ